VFRCLALLALAGCRTPGVLCVAVSVDWEGASLEEVDLSALERLERELPGVPLTHFANAAYFTKPGADPERVRAVMRRVIREGDEVGLHVHPWHHLVEAAGVEPRFEPSFLGQRDSEIDGESGYDIELEAYGTEEIEAIVKKSIELLALDPPPRSFRAGAWLSGPRVLEAIARAGFEIDSSATDASWYDELASTPLPSRLRMLWPNADAKTQPYWISTRAGPILEMPLTGGMADYATAEEQSAHLASMSEGVAQIGLHQEGCSELVDRTIAAIRSLGDRAQLDTVAGCAARVRARLQEHAAR
jgi:hypothetical protein